MQSVCEFRRQKVVNQAVSGDPIEAGEFRRDDSHPIMRVPPGRRVPGARANAGVSGVAFRFVDDGELLRFEGFRQTRHNSFLHGHAFALPAAGLQY